MSVRKPVIDCAIAEWMWFGKDEGRKDKHIAPNGATTVNKGPKARPYPRKETVEPYAGRVGDYWLSISSKDYDHLLKNFAKSKGKLDGTVNLPWSTAFISYCMQMAGAGTDFPYSSGHAAWIVKSIKNKNASKLNAALVGYRPGEIVLRPGDIVANTRQSGVTYDNAVAKGWFPSHSDIVVEVDLKNRKAYAIGGNVGQSVSKVEVPISASGKIAGSSGLLVHIQNNIVHKPLVVADISATSLVNAKVG